ncbi:MAG: tetratricopeptide repeat protein [Gemmataceae bacterium]
MAKQLRTSPLSFILRLEPNNPEAYRQRGLCYSHNRQMDKAIADQTKAIDLAPNDPWAYYFRANLHRLMQLVFVLTNSAVSLT